MIICLNYDYLLMFCNMTISVKTWLNFFVRSVVGTDMLIPRLWKIIQFNLFSLLISFWDVETLTWTEEAHLTPRSAPQTSSHTLSLVAGSEEGIRQPSGHEAAPSLPVTVPCCCLGLLVTGFTKSRENHQPTKNWCWNVRWIWRRQQHPGKVIKNSP